MGVSFECLAMPVNGTRWVKLPQLTGALRVSSIVVIFVVRTFLIYSVKHVRNWSAICLFMFRFVVRTAMILNKCRNHWRI